MKFSEIKNVAKALSFFIGIILIGYAAVLAVGLYTYAVKSKVLKTDFLYIPTGATLSEQAALLVKNEFLQDTSEYMNFARKMGDTTVYSGKFSLTAGMTYRELMNVIGGGKQTPTRLIFNNIDYKEELAAKLSEQIELDSAAIMEMFSNDTLLNKFNLTRDNAPYIFMPNTYEVYWNISQEKLLSMMKREYDKFWSKRDSLLANVGLSRDEVIILASIVYKECYLKEEMPLVASVYLNRLRKKMLLQACPTVKYALGDKTLRRVLHEHLKIDSPYNTYIHTGLPPTPICIPSLAAIDAVLNYTKSDYLYFCASEKLDHTQRFTASYAEHSRNSARYARALDRAGIKE